LSDEAKPFSSDSTTYMFKIADYFIGAREKTPLAKTVRTCRQLLKVEPAMWFFVTVSGVEPTNNAASKRFVLR